MNEVCYLYINPKELDPPLILRWRRSLLFFWSSSSPFFCSWHLKLQKQGNSPKPLFKLLFLVKMLLFFPHYHFNFVIFIFDFFFLISICMYRCLLLSQNLLWSRSFIFFHRQNGFKIKQGSTKGFQLYCSCWKLMTV